MKGWVEGHPLIFSVGPPMNSSIVPNQPVVSCKLEGFDVCALLDTGSMKSFVSQEIFAQLCPKPVLAKTSQNCVSITGQPLVIAGSTQLELSFPHSGSVSYVGQFLVSSTLCSPLECVLGWDFLTSNNLHLSCTEDGSYHLVGLHGFTPLSPHHSPPLPPIQPPLSSAVSSCLLSQSTHRGPVPLSVQSSFCIPSRTEQIISCSIPKSHREQLGMVVPLPDAASIPSHILPAYTVSCANDRSVYVRLMNTSNIDVELQVGQKIGEFCPLVETLDHSSSQCYSVASSFGVQDTASIATQLEANINSDLHSEDKNALLQTLLKFSDVFDESLGHTDVIQHHIDTGSAPPVRQYPRRLPYAYREEAKQQITDMLQQGVIQPSHSPWASPIVLVKKKDGKYRFCIDYRKLNGVTKKDAHPLPRVDDLLDALHGSHYFSTLDLRSGYWQVSVADKDREKTAFITPDGLWEFIRLPFGVCGGPATFQRAIEIILSGLTYDTCLCYFDDIIIPSTSLEQQCERLSAVLSRFRQHNLRVKASKCTFGATHATFLGHVVSSKGVHTDPQKVQAVSSLSAPTTIEQVRSFLGLAGYYRRFIPNFATLSYPLVQLTKKGSKFSWSDKQQESFLLLKSHLCSAPILAYPQFDRPFTLQTDASDVGLGAVLTQFDLSGREHVISYASRSLSDREKKYSATEKEALAVVFATDHFRAYLLGRKFTVVTDHHALQWLHSVNPKGRLGRWVMDLQEYSFDVRHRPGNANGNADALSRLPSVSSCATTIHPGYNLLQAQQDDLDIHTVLQLKSNDQPRPPYFVWARNPTLRVFWHCWDNLHIVNGFLVKDVESINGSIPEYAFVIPTKLIVPVLNGIHSSPFSGHMGVKRTLLRARNRFFWPKMAIHIKDFVNSCAKCAEHKHGPHHNKAPPQTIEVNEPFVFWAMDYMGPLPETARGNKHLLVIMDHFTKWCEAFPTQDQRASTVAELLVSRVFSRFGPPTIVHSDQGRNFESNLMYEICRLMGIHKSRTTAYHPQCDGQVERQNQTLQNILSSFVSQHRDDWDNWVALAVYAYNTSCHASTGLSPYEMVFGRDARTPIELDLGLPLKNPCSQSEYTQSLRHALSSIRKAAQVELDHSRSSQIASHSYSFQKPWSPYIPGTSVWLRRPKSWKFGSRWVGPYEVISRRGVTYRICSKEGKEMIAHHDNIKPCVLPVREGIIHCPAPEDTAIHLLPGEPTPHGGINCQNQHPASRPAHLRQNIQPPLRYGEFVVH